MSHASKGLKSRNSRKSRHYGCLLTVSAIRRSSLHLDITQQQLGRRKQERNPKGVGKLGAK